LKKIKELYLKYKEIVNYLIVGVLTTIVGLGVYYGLVFTILDPKNPIQLQAANIISWIAAVTFAYITNRRFVFESKSENVLNEAVRFYLARVGTLLMDMGIMFLLVTVLGANDKIAKIVGQVVVTIANYVFSKLFVFKKKNKEEECC
jgi:putative flippase GtrA